MPAFLTEDVVLTGLPRSGSAVVGALADALPDTVCLNQPEWHFTIARKLGAPIPFTKWLVGEYHWQRLQLLGENPVPDQRAEDGSALLDGLVDPRCPRDETDTPKPVYISRPGLTEQFRLCMRHTTLYTAILPTLTSFGHFHVVAIIRHPVDVILSWLKHPSAQVAPGNPHGLLRLWPEAHEATSGDAPQLDKLAHTAELFFQRYYEMRDAITILKYEDIVANPMLLSAHWGYDRLPASVSKIIQPPQARINADTEAIRSALKKYAVFTRKFYPDL